MRRKNRGKIKEHILLTKMSRTHLITGINIFPAIKRLTVSVMLPKLFYTDCNLNVWASLISPNKCEILTGIRISHKMIGLGFKKKFCPHGKQYKLSYKGVGNTQKAVLIPIFEEQRPGGGLGRFRVGLGPDDQWSGIQCWGSVKILVRIRIRGFVPLTN